MNKPYLTPSELRAWISGAGGRRFVLTVGAGIVDTILLCIGRISESGYLQLTAWTVAVYIAGHTIEQVKANATVQTPDDPGSSAASDDGIRGVRVPAGGKAASGSKSSK